MYWKNIKFAYQIALRTKYISLFNVLGLSIGLACTLFLLSWVSNELSFDSFFNNKENIYRLNFNGEINSEYIKTCSSPQGIGPEALAVFPEVNNYTRIRMQPRTPFKIEENHFYIDEGLVADSTFFSVFSYKALIGDLSQSLNRKDLVVIDEYLAEKCFGSENAIGKLINIGNQDYTVSAVIKNIPGNSHLQFHYIIPVLNLSKAWQNNKWGSDNCTQYLVLDDDIDKITFEDKLSQMLQGKNKFWKNFKVKLTIQRLDEIHFSSGYMLENAVKGNLQNVYILIVVSFLILLIASVNFTNMFISTSLKRAKSTAIKTALGASKRIIIKEFSIEVLLYILASFILSVVLVELVLPVFNNLIDTHLDIQILSLNFLLISVPLIILTFLLAGLFPGFYITRLNPAIVLKTGFAASPRKKNNFQRGLVILQFVIAIILIRL